MKANRSRRRRLFIIASELISVITLFFFSTSTLLALPGGQQVVNGQVSFNTQGNTLTVTNSPNSIINWQRFSINTNEAVRFAQQSSTSAVLNRVIGPYSSNIFGLLQSNGRVFLINPNGILFGQGAKIDVNGFVASTLNISNQDFLAGKYNFTAGTVAGSIQNQGTITTPEGGKVYLIAPDIENSGIINTPKGDVVLAAGHSVQLVDSLDPDIAVVVNAPADRAVNLGQIVSESGRIGIYGGLISQKGTVSADSAVVGENGKIIFKATKEVTLDPGSVTSAKGGGTISVLADKQNGTVNVAGTLDASAPNGGDGGFIETSAASVKIADTAHITTLAPYGKTGTWLIDPNDYIIAASGGDITGATLGSNLNSSNVTILSDSGTVVTTSGNGDILIYDAVSWGSTNTLTLNAQRNIFVDQFINATGNGSIVMRSDYSGTGTGTVTFGTYGTVAVFYYKVTFNSGSSGTADVYYNPTGGYSAPTNYSTFFNNVTPTAYMLVNTDTNLQNMNTNLAGTYALGKDIDASATSGWNSGAGFAPIGNSSTNSFSGTFDGLGHTITSLFIYRPNTYYVGLFGYTGSSATIKNIGLSNSNITGAQITGGLAGNNDGTITNSYTTGSVTGTGWTAPASDVGGLVGFNAGTIINSYSSATVTDNGNSDGGLVGYNIGLISNSYSTGAVNGNNEIGGLVGYNNGGSINNSYSTGAVNGISDVGGLVGNNNGKIDSTYSTGLVTGTTNVGGLAGVNSGTIANSYWDTNTSGQSTSAGGTGLTTAQMMAQSNFGGWDFTNTWRIYEGYTYPLLKSFLKPLTVTVNDATKTYDGTNYNGSAGLVYSTGLRPAEVFGTDTYAGTRNAGFYSSVTPTGLYSVQQGYDITFVSGTLTVNQLPVTLTGSRTYDGTADAASGILSITNIVGTDIVSLGGGTGTLASKNAGTQPFSSMGSLALTGTDSANYTFTGASGTVSINQAALTITAQTNTKTYDGTTSALAAPTVAGLQTGDSVTGAT
ncbi:MAG: filamentous hemagglutinin N-terminal domain-containing protein, partial [Syntrophaceae bacterium]